MHISPSILARQQRSRPKKIQDGTVVSYTTLTHPPAAFGPRPRTIALIALDDGTKTLAAVIGQPEIGSRVRPRMRLSTVTDEKLRVYDIAFEVLAERKSPIETKEFPGYILALSGPTGVGKSTVTKTLLSMFTDYTCPVPLITTRARQENDHEEFLFVTEKKFQELLKNHELAASAQIPPGHDGHWYGYRKADIEKIWKSGKIPVVTTEMHLLHHLAEHFGRRSILSFGLLPPGRSKRTMLSHLLRRLRLRGKVNEEHLKSAERDLAFLKEHTHLFDKILVNKDVETVVEMLRKNVPGLAGA